MCPSSIAPSPMRNQEIAGLLARRRARIDEDTRARDQRRRHLALIGTAGANARRCARRDRRPHPSMTGVRETWRARRCRRRARHRRPSLTPRTGRPVASDISAQTPRDAAAFGTPDADLGQRPDVADRLEVAARLHARADDAEHARVRPRQMLHRHRGDRRRPRFGDVAAIHHRHQRAGRVIEQHDGGQVRRQAALVIAVVDGDELGAHGRRIVKRRGHDAEVTRGPAPTSRTVRTGWLHRARSRTARSAPSMAAIRSGMGSTARTSRFGQQQGIAHDPSGTAHYRTVAAGS